MKALINLAVEIDLSQIICDDSMDALKMFTGEATKEGVGTFYMDKLARTITSAKEFSMPHVKYQLSGNIIPSENLEDYNMMDVVDEPIDSTIEGIVENNLENPMVDALEQEDVEEARNQLFESVMQFVETVSINKGLPKEIGITAEIFDNICVLVNGEVMSSIGGIPVVRKDIESALEVVYEPYNGMGILESAYLPTLGNLI